MALTRFFVRSQVTPPILSSGGRRVSRAAEPLHQVHAGQRHIELGLAGVFQKHVIAGLDAVRDLAKPQEAADAVLGVNHVVACLEVGQVRRERAQRAPGGGPGDQFGGVEQVLGPEHRDQRIEKHRSAPHLPPDQERADHRPRHVGTLRHKVRGAAGRLDAELERNRVLLQDVGQPLQFAGRGAEEHRAASALHHVARLGDGHRHIAVEGHRRPRGDFQLGLPGAQREFGECNLSGLAELLLELRPSQEQPLRRAEPGSPRLDPGVSTIDPPPRCSRSGSSQTMTILSASAASVPWRGLTSGVRNSQPGNSSSSPGAASRPASSRSLANSSRDLGHSAMGSSVHCSTFNTERCDSASNNRIDSTRSPRNSTRTGRGDSGEKTSRMPPRTEYSPTISTGSLRS